MATTKNELKARVAAYREVLNTATNKLADKDVSEVSKLLPSMKNDSTVISANTRIIWNGKIKKAINDISDNETNNPDNAPDLWENIDYKDGIRIIPKTITFTTKFELNELGYSENDGKVYKSLVSENLNTPDQNIDDWEEIQE